jgi:hypothetical protein
MSSLREVGDGGAGARGAACPDEFRPDRESVLVTVVTRRTTLPGTRHHGGHHDDHAGRPDHRAARPPARRRPGHLAGGPRRASGPRESPHPRGRRHRRGPPPTAHGGVRRDGRGRRTRRPGPVPGPLPGPRRARGLQAHVARRRAAPGAVRGLHHHGLASAGRRLPQRPRRLVRRPDLGPPGRGGLLRRVHGLHPALVLGARRGRAGRPQHGSHHLLPARRRPRVPHLLHDGPWQRAGQRVLGPARHDALRPPRGVGGRPRGLAGTGVRYPTDHPEPERRVGVVDRSGGLSGSVGRCGSRC